MKTTVKDLKEYIAMCEEKYGSLDDVQVVIERVRDIYFEKHGWEIIPFDFDGIRDGEYIRVFQPHLKVEDGEVKALAIESHY